MFIEVQGKKYEVPDSFKDLDANKQQEVIRDIVRSKIQQNNEMPDRTQVGNAKGLARAGLGQGLLFGFGDELEAGIRTGGGLFGNYDDKVGQIRNEIRDYQAQNPGKAISAELGGALLPTLGAAFLTSPAGGTGGAAVGASTAARIAARAAQGATQSGALGAAKAGARGGAMYGGAYGIGTGESEAGAGLGQIAYDRAMSGLKGATVGATVGGVAAPVIGGAVKGITGLKNKLQGVGNTNADEAFANRKIAEAMNKDGTDVHQQYANLKARRDALIAEATKNKTGFGDEIYSIDAQMSKLSDDFNLGVQTKGGVIAGSADDLTLPNTIADSGEATQRMAYAANSISNPANAKVGEQLVNRQADQAQRIIGNTHAAAKTDPTKLGINYIDDLALDIQTMAKRGYQEADQVKIGVGQFEKFFKNPAYDDLLKDAAKRATKILRADGKDVVDLNKILADKGKSYFGSFDDFMKQDLGTDFFHALKMGMDDIIEANTKVDVFGKTIVTKYGQKVTNTKNGFNDIIKANNKQYEKMNAKYSGKKRLEENFEFGSKINKYDLNLITKKFEKMNPGEQEAFRSGVMTHFSNLADKTKGGNFVQTIMGNAKNKKIMEMVIGNKADYKKWLKYMDEEKMAHQTFKKTLTGSPTEQRFAAKAELEGPMSNMFSQVASGGARSAVVNLASKAVTRLKGVTPQRAKLISEKLFTSDKEAQKLILDQIAKENKKVASEVAKLIKAQQIGGAKVAGGAFGTGVVADPNR